MILVDAHIHIHECYNLNKFLDAAENNFSNNLSILGSDDKNSCIICFTESEGVNFFDSFKKEIENDDKYGNWSIILTNDSNCLLFRSSNNFEIYIFAGRQIVTAESLEVLAIGLENEIKDGLLLNEVISKVNSSGKISIIPWGAGKWMGKRGQFVEKLILEKRNFPIFLGDNGNRPWFWKISNLFKLAESKKIFNLPGTDPLPFNNQELRPGNFGFCLDGYINSNKPYEDFLNKIKNISAPVKTYGKLETSIKFFKNQIAMQLVKRKRNRK